MSKLVVFALSLLVQSVIGGSSFFPSENVPYCTKNISLYEIPDLTSSQQSLVSSLLQVQAVIRHGSRTPYANFSCWQDYDVIWNDCNVTELMLSSPSLTLESEPPAWLFRKIYDASPNYFGGNCLTGQMVSAGYYQEQTLGMIMREAYLSNKTAVFPLFNSTDWTEVNSSKIYLRSDDEQRTLMSGQLLLQGMFNRTQDMDIYVHTGDKDLDQISPNTNVCPYLNTISDNAYASDDYVAENTSTAVNDMTSDLNEIFGANYWDWNHVMDCMYTTVCTEREIPSISNTTAMTDALFNDSIAQVEYTYAYRALYNDSEWSKLAMGNMFYWIRERMQLVVDGNGAAFKLVVYAAHDTTIMPMLAVLLGDEWDGLWPGYASILTFEVYAGNNATTTVSHYFRMVYNSKPLLLPGCSDTLCDINELLDSMSFAQDLMPGCTYPSASSNVVATSSNDDDDDLNTNAWVGICVASGVFGSIMTLFLSYLYQMHYATSANAESKAVLMGITENSSG